MMLLSKNKLLPLVLLTGALLAGTIALMSTATAASWTLAPAKSQLNFLSIKKSNVVEVHQFKGIQGDVDGSGKFTIAIDLTSVDTHNEVRDGRMKEFLFEIAQYTHATVTGQLDMDELDAIAEGANAELLLDATLDLHGQSQPITLDLVVTRLAGAKMSVATLRPVILNVGDFGLVAGVEKLRDLAKLPSISHAVPVSFFMTFKFVP